MENVLDYVTTTLPDLIVLGAPEVVGEGGLGDSMVPVEAALRGRGYEIQSFVADAADFGLPLRKPRPYLVAVARATPLLWFPADSAYDTMFAVFLKHVQETYMQGPSLQDFLDATCAHTKEYVCAQARRAFEAGLPRPTPYEDALLAYCRRVGIRVPTLDAARAAHEDEVFYRALNDKQKLTLAVAQLEHGNNVLVDLALGVGEGINYRAPGGAAWPCPAGGHAWCSSSRWSRPARRPLGSDPGGRPRVQPRRAVRAPVAQQRQRVVVLAPFGRLLCIFNYRGRQFLVQQCAQPVQLQSAVQQRAPVQLQFAVQQRAPPGGS